MNFGRVNPARTLDAQGITGLGEVHYNLIEPALVAVLSVVIGAVLLSVMLPLLSILSAIA